MDAATLALRLSDPTLPHAVRLAQLCVDEALSQPVTSLAPPARVETLALEFVRGWLASEEALGWLARAVEEVRKEAVAADSLGDVLPGAAVTALEQLAARPWSPDKAVVMALLDRRPVRQLVRELLMDTLVEFGKTVGAPVQGVAKGITGFAKKATERAGILGAVASAVGSEVERQLEKKAAEFADQALSGVLQELADDFSNPARARAQAELRVALLEGVLQLHGGALARELVRLDVVGGARLVREALAGWLATPDAEAKMRQAVARLLAWEGERPLGERLSELGVREPVRAFAVEALTLRIRAVAQGEPFRAFAEALLAP